MVGDNKAEQSKKKSAELEVSVGLSSEPKSISFIRLDCVRTYSENNKKNKTTSRPPRSIFQCELK